MLTSKVVHVTPKCFICHWPLLGVSCAPWEDDSIHPFRVRLYHNSRMVYLTSCIEWNIQNLFLCRAKASTFLLSCYSKKCSMHWGITHAKRYKYIEKVNNVLDHILQKQHWFIGYKVIKFNESKILSYNEIV